MKNKTRARRSRTTENIAAVIQIFEENPGLYIPRRSLELCVPQTSLHGILYKDLPLKIYKVQLTPELKLSDRVHFHFDGYVIKQNSRIWDSKNIRFIVKKSLYL